MTLKIPSWGPRRIAFGAVLLSQTAVDSGLGPGGATDVERTERAMAVKGDPGCYVVSMGQGWDFIQNRRDLQMLVGKDLVGSAIEGDDPAENWRAPSDKLQVMASSDKTNPWSSGKLYVSAIICGT